MRAPHDPSDVTDDQWALVEPLIPVYPGGRPRKTSTRDVLDAVSYVLRTGGQWRYLPTDFPPKSTAWRYFDEWRHNGTLDTIHDRLRRQVRTQEKPYAPRTTASVDRPSVGTTSGGEHRGRDNHKNVDGRERHIVVDSMGLLLAVPVTAAGVDDATAAQERLTHLEGQPVGKVARVFADNTYHNHARYAWVEAHARWELVIVRRPSGQKGWVKLPLRWAVERTFAWLGQCRRLTRDRERTVRSSEAFVKLAMAHLMLNRLEPKHADAEFQYHTAAQGQRILKGGRGKGIGLHRWGQGGSRHDGIPRRVRPLPRRPPGPAGGPDQEARARRHPGHRRVRGHLRGRHVRAGRAVREGPPGVAQAVPRATRRHPSHDTFNRVFAALDREKFAAGFARWMADLSATTGLRAVAVDGKACRAAPGDTFSGCLHLVSAWATENGVILGRVAAADGSHEVAAVPELLRVLDLSGARVTMDAAGCQKATLRQIRDQGGDDLVARRGTSRPSRRPSTRCSTGRPRPTSPGAT